MSFLERLEKLSEKYIEGIFKGKSTDHIQPVEIAKKISREMRDGKTISVSKVYVPNSYTVYLSPPDWETYEAVTSSLARDMANFVTTKATEKKYVLVSKPVIKFEMDEKLTLGHCRVAGKFIEAPPASQPATATPVQGTSAGPTPVKVIPAPPNPVITPVTAVKSPVSGVALGGAKEGKNAHENTLIVSKGAFVAELPVVGDTLTHDKPAAVAVLEVKEGIIAGKRFLLRAGAQTIGRLQQNDIALPDTNISRRHVRLEYVDGSFLLSDLGSTNGTFVNNERVTQTRLESGDLIRLGKMLLEFRVD